MRFCFLVLTTIICSMQANAQTSYDEIYARTYANCSKTLNASGAVNIARLIWRIYQPRSVREGLLQVVTTSSGEDIALAIQTRGLTPRVAVYLESPSFYEALEHCYGDNEYLRKTYVAGLVMSDLSGKVAGIGIAVGVGSATSRLLSPILTPIFKRYPITKGLLIGGSTSYAAYLAYKEYLNLNREPTPEERAAAEKLIEGPLQKSAQLMQEVRSLVLTRIEELKLRRMTANEAERPLLDAQVQTHQANLDKLSSLMDPKVSP